MKHIREVQSHYINVLTLVPREAPLARFVQVLPMHHLQGIHKCGVEASQVMLGPCVILRPQRCGGWVD
jgi:hypothetical protein